MSKSLAGTAADGIMKIEGWKTEGIENYYVGSTTDARVPESKRKRDRDCAAAGELPLSQAFESDSSACAPKYA